MLRTRVPLLSCLAALALLASACGGSDPGAGSSAASDPPSSAAPSSPSSSPSKGPTVTPPGSMLSFGDPATVAFTANPKRASDLSLAVTKVVKGRIADLSDYRLDAATKASTPYYVSVTVRNVGDGDLGRTAIPLWGLSSTDILIGASGFTNRFTRCPSRALPRSFAGGAETDTCLMYLMPRGATLEGVSYRPLKSDQPIVWKGRIVSSQKNGQKQDGQKNKNQKPNDTGKG